MRTHLARKRLKKIKGDKINTMFNVGNDAVDSDAPLNQRQFKLTEEQVDKLLTDNVDRVFIDQYQDVGEGKKYKGQWNKGTNERNGLGV